jgi:hypothetical protein
MGEPWSSANGRCFSHLAALCGRVVERGELAEDLCGFAVAQKSLQQVEEIPILKIHIHKKKEKENEHENVQSRKKREK